MIRAEQQGVVTVLHMKHGKANTIDVEFCEQLIALLKEPSASAFVLVGRGAVFSAGVDLLRIVDEGAPYIRRFLDVLAEFCIALFGCPRPLIAAVNGHAIAGGCVLACAADRRIMAQGPGRIGVAELKVGTPFPVGPLEIMRFAVPTRHFSEIVYGGETYEAPEALERGLVDEVVEPAALLERAIEVAVDLGGRPAQAFQITKAQIRRPALERMKNGAAHDAEVLSAWTSQATLSIIRRFVSRTFKPMDS